jgi:type IV pilus biogenesis/stability protein PilW
MERGMVQSDRGRLFALLIAVVLCAAGLSGCATGKDKAGLAEAARDLGEAYMAQGDYRMALKELLKAVELTPADPHVHNDLGLAYLALQKPELGLGHFKKAVEIQPDYAAALNNLGTAYLALEKWDEAVTCFEQVSEMLLYATPHFPLTNLGYIYYKKKDYPKAIQYYTKALEAAPDFSGALRGLGRTLTAMGRYTEAITVLEKAVRRAPRFIEAYEDLANAYLLKGNRKKAVEMLNRAVGLAPADSPVTGGARKKLRQLQGMK